MEPTKFDTLLFEGGEVKALEEGRVGGYLIRFSSDADPDLENDFFTASTDFGTHAKSPVLYHHGLDSALKSRTLGWGDLRTDDVGVWVEAQLELRDDYEKAIYALAEAGKLGWSSGTAAHLVEREMVGKAHFIKSWPLGLDASLTPIPAEPRTKAVPLKSLMESHMAELMTDPETESPEADGSSAVAPVEDGAKNIVINDIEPIREEPTMSEHEKTEATANEEETKGIGNLSERVDGLTKALEGLMGKLEQEPAFERAGYATNIGGAADPQHKSLGDWLLAVRRKDTKRLNQVYKSIKDMDQNLGSQGGYLVPTEYSQQLMQVMSESSGIVSRVTRIPVNAPSGEFPALDVYAAPTAGAGNTAWAGGVVSTTTAEGAALTETQATIDQLQFRVNKLGGYTEVTNELVSDSPLAIETLLNSLFSAAINARLERNIIRGIGGAEFLGILNSNAAIAITPATNNAFGEADALTMLSRFKSMSGRPGSIAWIMHPGVIPDFNGFTASNADLVDWNAGLRGSLLSYPILYSEHAPQDDNAGNVILADLGAYLLFERQGISVDFSEHAAFTNDKGTWKFSIRADGMPWLRNTITLADPQGSYTVSPFVYHND